MICGQRVNKATLLHQHKAGAIDETPILVKAAAQKLPGAAVSTSVNMHNFHKRRCPNSVNEGDERRAGNSQWRRQQCNQLRNNVIGRDNLICMPSRRAIDIRRQGMKGLARVSEICPPRRVCKQLSHVSPWPCCPLVPPLARRRGIGHAHLPSQAYLWEWHR